MLWRSTCQPTASKSTEANFRCYFSLKKKIITILVFSVSCIVYNFCAEQSINVFRNTLEQGSYTRPTIHLPNITSATPLTPKKPMNSADEAGKIHDKLKTISDWFVNLPHAHIWPYVASVIIVAVIFIWCRRRGAQSAVERTTNIINNNPEDKYSANGELFMPRWEAWRIDRIQKKTMLDQLAEILPPGEQSEKDKNSA